MKVTMKVTAVNVTSGHVHLESMDSENKVSIDMTLTDATEATDFPAIGDAAELTIEALPPVKTLPPVNE